MRGNQYVITGYEPVVDQNTDHCMIASTIEDAEDCFVDAKERLLDINNWNKYSPIPGVTFRLTDGHGRPVNRKAHKGDHVKIELASGSGAHCCGVVESIEYDDYPDLCMEAFTLRLRPCVHGQETSDEHDEIIEGAMVIERRYKHIYTSFHARNVLDHANTSESLCGLTPAQWNSLAKKFVA